LLFDGQVAVNDAHATDLGLTNQRVPPFSVCREGVEIESKGYFSREEERKKLKG
jgi:hypothetical protein